MSKVIVERPRRSGHGVRKGRQPRDFDLEISHQGMRKPYQQGYNYKELNENLAPLLRFLTSRVGKKWDDVYSEICEHIKVTSTVQEHVRGHITDFVATRTHIDSLGQIWINKYGSMKLEDYSWLRLYVDPQTGLLCHNPYFENSTALYRTQKQQAAEKLLETARSLPDGIELRKHKGIWYQVTQKEIPCSRTSVVHYSTGPKSLEIPGTAFDMLRHETLYRRGNKVTDRKGNWHNSLLYCDTKRQLNHSELKKYGLSND